MANVERKMDETQAAGDLEQPRNFQLETPVVEKLNAGITKYADEIIKRRAEAVEEMMDEGLPPEKYSKTWQKINTYVSRQTENKSSALSRFLADEENTAALDRLTRDLKENKAWNDIIVDEEDTSSGRNLKAMEVFSQLLNESARNGHEKHRQWDEMTGDEEAKRLVRVSEIVKAEVMVIKAKQQLLTDAEKSDSGQYLNQLNALARSDDVPEIYRQRAREAEHNWRIEKIRGSSASPTKQEKVFKREVIRTEDKKAMAREINEQLRAGTPQSVFAAARGLARLKQAGVKISEQHEKKVFDQLLSQRQEMLKHDAIVTARYATYLKYLGVIREANKEEKAVIQRGIKKRVRLGGRNNLKTKDLSMLLVNAKYLKADNNFDQYKRRLEQEIKAVNKPGNEQKVALRLARVKYLKVTSEEMKSVQTEQGKAIDNKVSEYQAKGQWDKFVKLRLLVNYARGENTTIDEQTRDNMIKFALTMRSKSHKNKKWHQFASYMGTFAELLKKLKQKSPQVTDEQAGVINFQSEKEADKVYQFLRELSKKQQETNA